tara:strand:+ start:34936 stop:36066 length:1131 start_codon:yes stop_codon:yes gene_type:complete
MKVLVLLILTSVFLGCSTESDPLKGYPDNVRNGLPPKKIDTPVSDKTRVTELLLSMSPELPVFIEGEELQLSFDGRFVSEDGEPARNQKITIENLPEGARWDEATNTMTWSPSTDFLRGSDFQTTVVLDVSFEGIRNGEFLRTQKQFMTWVRRPQDRAPRIIAMDEVDSIKEGEWTSFTLTVEDLDSYDGTNGIPPRLSFFAGNRGFNGSHLMGVVGNPVAGDEPNTWIYSVSMDTRSKELTRDVSGYSVSIEATSRFGKKSLPEQLAFDVETKLNTPVLSDNEIVLYAASKNTFSFSVSSPSGEGRMLANLTCTGMELANCSCANTISSSRCSVEWDATNIPGIQPGGITITLDAVLRTSRSETNLGHTFRIRGE